MTDKSDRRRRSYRAAEPRPGKARAPAAVRKPAAARAPAATRTPAATDTPAASTGARSKAALRQELEQATRQFLRGGGEVQRVPTGTSAWEPGTRPPPSQPLFTQPRGERTPLNDVVATLEARREAMKRKRKPVAKRRSERSRRRIIYDDFGEPLRHVWVDD